MIYSGFEHKRGRNLAFGTVLPLSRDVLNEIKGGEPPEEIKQVVGTNNKLYGLTNDKNSYYIIIDNSRKVVKAFKVSDGQVTTNETHVEPGSGNNLQGQDARYTLTDHATNFTSTLILSADA